MKSKKWWIVNIVIMVTLIIIFNAIMYPKNDATASVLLIGALAGGCSWFITNQIIKH